MRIQKGFTLIELLVVIAILGIISVGFASGFQQFNRRQNISTAMENLRNDLQAVKANASSQSIVTNVCRQANRTLVGHQITFSTTSYQLEEVCRQGSNAPTAHVYKTVELTGIEVSNNPGSIRFLVLNRGLAGGAKTVSLRNLSNNETRVIQVDDSGVIYAE
jgi:prepilin-type N-terminal cleavage/methylation domain-containing protein